MTAFSGRLNQAQNRESPALRSLSVVRDFLCFISIIAYIDAIIFFCEAAAHPTPVMPLMPA
ncbi:MAG: hypothetical protein ACYSPI_05585, partial [Planctomycetota bacterium]